MFKMATGQKQAVFVIYFRVVLLRSQEADPQEDHASLMSAVPPKADIDQVGSARPQSAKSGHAGYFNSKACCSTTTGIGALEGFFRW